MDFTFSRKYQTLGRILRDLGQVAVAFSGGVDSTLLLKVAVDILGRERVLAFHAASLLQTAQERENAWRLAQAIGGRLEILQLAPLAWPEFVANPSDRCYHCKKRIYSAFLAQAAALQIPQLVDGTNADDLTKVRPGLKALQEFGIRTPLAEAGLTKKEIRLLSRELCLETWQQASSSCLATRIPAGTPITRERLGRAERAEHFLGSLGFSGCRVRLTTDRAVTLELSQGELGRMTTDSLRDTVLDFFLSIGIEKVFLDLSERDGIVF